MNRTLVGHRMREERWLWGEVDSSDRRDGEEDGEEIGEFGSSKELYILNTLIFHLLGSVHKNNPFAIMSQLFECPYVHMQ